MTELLPLPVAMLISRCLPMLTSVYQWLVHASHHQQAQILLSGFMHQCFVSEPQPKFTNAYQGLKMTGPH